ncbi:MAG: glycosyltransferase family 4 protein [Candidatus Yanofskybacteria bacterium]|nr:glycosyltransferase family 4 protein [Candidatus Yanofskybacteria bacterium]
MYKIAIECHNLENKRWGIGRHLSKILEEISKKSELAKEFKFYLYFKGFVPDDPYLNNPIFVKKVLKLPFLRPSYNIFFHVLLPLACLRDKINATFFPGFMLPLFFLGKSLVVLTNDVYYEYKFGTHPWKYRISYLLFSNWAAKRATKITTFTESAKKEISQLFKIPPERIMVNYLGIDQPNKPITYNLKLRTYLLYVGQALPRRRAKETIQAFEILADKFPDLKLILVGQDKYNPPILKSLIQETNKRLGGQRVMHYDYIDKDEDLKFLIAGAKLFIYLSTSEAMGLPPLEALALGTPPLVKNNDLNKEIYEGSAFFVQDETDPQQIASAIERALNNRQKMEEVILNSPRITSKFNWEKHTEKLIQIFKELCSIR